jgi:hypothetical protein
VKSVEDKELCGKEEWDDTENCGNDLWETGGSMGMKQL